MPPSFQERTRGFVSLLADALASARFDAPAAT